MKPLATLNYTKNNLIKALPIFISMMVGVFLVYFISLVGKNSVDTMDITKYKFLDSYIFVHTDNGTSLPEDIVEKVKNSSSVEKIVPLLSNRGAFIYNSVFGSMSFYNLNLYDKDISTVLSRLDMKLIEGRLPVQDKNEVLIPDKYAKQKKLKTDDSIGSEVSPEYGLKGKYIISGIIEGPILISITSNNTDQISPDNAAAHSFMFSLKDNDDKSIIKELNCSKTNNVIVADYDYVKGALGYVLEVLNAFTLSLDLVTILVLCISLGNLNYMNFLNRKYEFGVLSVIGYKKTKLYFKLWKENLLVCLSGFGAGLVLATLVSFLANITVWEIDGKSVPLWSASGIAYSLAVPLLVSIFGLLPPIRELRKVDPIDVLGGNI
jgi:putative ABC transport system permease protein